MVKIQWESASESQMLKVDVVLGNEKVKVMSMSMDDQDEVEVGGRGWGWETNNKRSH